MTVLKKVLFATILLSFTATLSAQFSFGVRGGITLPNVAFNDEAEEESVDYLVYMGATFGVVAELKISDHFAIQPEMMLTQKGFKIDYDDYYYYYYYYGNNPSSSETKFRLNYIEAPILAKGIFGNESISGYVAVGPVFGYAASGSTYFNGRKVKFGEDEWDGFKRFEVSASAGAGVGLSVGTGQVFLDLRYLFGLSNLADDDEFKVWNRTMGISVGYLHSL